MIFIGTFNDILHYISVLELLIKKNQDFIFRSVLGLQRKV